MEREFNNRIAAQRAILCIINRKAWSTEQLFGLSSKAIDNQVCSHRNRGSWVRLSGGEHVGSRGIFGRHCGPTGRGKGAVVLQPPAARGRRRGACSFGGIPHDEAEKNMRLFASRVLPVLQRDSAFATPPIATMASLGAAKTDLFAPA